MESLASLVQRFEQRILSGDANCDYFDLIRRISLSNQNSPPFGFGRDVNAEIVRIKQNPKLAYAKNEIERVELDENGRVLVYENFFGLLGVNGPLPLAYSEQLYKRAYNLKDNAPLDFLNLINHRFLALFTRAFFINEQSFGSDFRKHDLISALFGALLGHVPNSYPGDQGYLTQSLSSFLNNESRSAVGLKAILRSYFKLPFCVSEFTQDKYLIPKDYRCRLGKVNAVLGHDLQLGSHFYSSTMKFSLIIKAVPYKTCQKFLPGQKKFFDLCRIIDTYLKRPLEFDLIFVLRRDQIPPLCLNGRSALGICAYLPFYSTGDVAFKVAASSFLNKFKSQVLTL